MIYHLKIWACLDGVDGIFMQFVTIVLERRFGPLFPRLYRHRFARFFCFLGRRNEFSLFLD